MRLNYDAVRAVLLYIEEKINYDEYNYIEQWDIINNIVENKHYTKNDLHYAIEVLLTTEFLNLIDSPLYSPDGDLIIVKIKGLTYEGCNFLDNIRKPQIWEAVKKKSKAFGGFSLSALSTAAGTLAKSLLSDPNAINNFLEGIDKVQDILK